MIIRAIILLLLCMNLGVAAWWTWHREPIVAALPRNEPGVSSIQLLGEAGAPPMVAAVAPVASAVLPAPAQVCVSLGPFSTPAALRQAMTSLTPYAGTIQYREVIATELRGYRVFLPPAADGGGALELARELTARGVRDYYVVTAGEQANTVSLGSYRDLDNAEKRRDQIAALGFNAVLEPRTEQVRQWWIDLSVARDFRWQDVLGEIALTVQDVACR